MKEISVYNIEANKIEKIMEGKGVLNTADVIEVLFEAIEDNNIDINDYI